MIWQLLSVLLLHQAVLPTAAASEDVQPIKALQFGTTTGDYVRFYPDMSRLKNAITVCAWVRKQLTGPYRSWLTYTTSSDTDEILISDAGRYNVIHSSYLDLRSAVTVPLNTWTHQCLSWTSSSGQMKVYYNGTLVGTKSVSRTPLREGGYINLGQDASSPETVEIFGGQLMKLSMFGKELTGSEVAELYNEGRCSETVEKKHQDIIFVSWESILNQSRTGNVREVDSGCPAPEEPTEEDCECPVIAHKMWDILLGDRFFNQTLTSEKLNELKAAWNILDRFVGVRMTTGIVEHLNMFHPSTKTETDCDTD